MRSPFQDSPVGIIDIGSNSVRLCVYDGGARVPVPLFNEKSVCALGRGLGASGRLHPEGATRAAKAVGRFVALSRAMKVGRLDILATAAVREASDGPAFVRLLERTHNIHITVLSGAEEAEMAAMGVLCGSPGADGIVADLGGGSLELVTVHESVTGPYVTMPLGVLRLSEASGDDRIKAAAIVEAHLKDVPWLNQGKNRPLYAVGGAWRAIARLCIAQTHHPLTVLDNFALSPQEALRIMELLSTQSAKSLEKISGVSKKRVGGLPMAALTLERVIRACSPSRLVFSIYGMREGRFFMSLPEDIRHEDPLLSVCRRMARVGSRFPEHGDELMAWMSGLFPQETPHEAHLRHAACLISDIFWSEHPDYRAEQAFLRILRLPFMGVSHRDRAAIATTVYQRYQPREESVHAQVMAQFLDETALKRCRAVGMALRFGHTLSGGAPGVLSETRLFRENGVLVLEVPQGRPVFEVESDRGNDRLAKMLECTSFEIKIVGS